MKNKVAQAVIIASLSSQGFALDLGEFNGTQFKIGGYLKAEGVFNNPDTSNSTFEGSASQSRLNVTTSRKEGDHNLTGFVEGDFRGDKDVFRLRHATITVDNLTVGQTWTGQFFANAPFDTEMINFYGTGIGTVSGNGAVVRPGLVAHYAKDGVRLTLQDPIYNEAHHPDMVAGYTHRTADGHAFNVAVTGRDVDLGNGDSEFGAALSLAAKLKFGDTSVSLSGFSGKGAAVYAGWGYNGSAGAATSEVDAQGDLITLTGFSAGVGHKLSDKLRMNLRYGQVTSDEVSSAVADDTLKLTTANIIYTYLPGLDIGVELRDQNIANRPASSDTTTRPAGQQVEVMAMYSF
ncbi:hypothetical protein [Marinomonas profundi]|nr:hypothetical protein [Marinomonas profundi]